MKTKKASSRELDKIDRHILQLLQDEGRMSYVELGDRVGLSTTPCMERVKRLEREKFILSYGARLNPQKLQANLLVFDFRRAATKLPHVLECHLVSGDFDYLIKARISEMASYRKLLGDILLRLPGVRESKSYIVMEELKETLAIPIPEPD